MIKWHKYFIEFSGCIKHLQVYSKTSAFVIFYPESQIKVIFLIDKILKKRLKKKMNPLDNMAWTVGAIGVLIGIAALKLPYNSSKGSIPEEAKNLRISFAIALGAAGFLLFINGLYINFTGALGTFADHWPVLFGGVPTLGGLVVIASAIVLYYNVSQSIVSYLAGIIGVFAAVDAYAIIDYGLTRNPTLASLGFLSAAGALWGSVLGANSDSKWLRYLFAILAFLFAIAWLYQGYSFTIGHLDPT